MNTDSWFDFWDKSDPYLKFLKIRDDNSYLDIQRTEVVQNNLNPIWKFIEISPSRLMNPNKEGFRYTNLHLELKYGTGKRVAKINSSEQPLSNRSI
jgi:hypothetical protein